MGKCTESELAVELALAGRLADRGHVGAALVHYHRIAGELVSRGEPQQALAAVMLAADLSPRCMYTKWALADLRRRCGDLVGARRSFAAILGAHLQAGRWLEAHAAQRAVLDVDPDDVRGRVQLGELGVRLGRVDEAYEHFRRAARRLYQEARHREYVWVARRVLSLQPHDADTLRELTTVFLQAGRIDDAHAHLHALLTAHPQDLGARELAIELLGVTGRVAEAVNVALALACELRSRRLLLEASRVLSRAARFAPGEPRVGESWVEIGSLLARAAVPDPGARQADAAAGDRERAGAAERRGGRDRGAATSSPSSGGCAESARRRRAGHLRPLRLTATGSGSGSARAGRRSARAGDRCGRARA